MLSLLLILIPAIASIILALSPRSIARFVALSAAVAELVVALLAFNSFAPNASVQYGYSIPWIASMGINFALGADGISMLLVFLTAFLVPIIVLGTFKQSFAQNKAFFALILLMQMGLMGVFLAQDAFIFYFFWEAALIPVYLLAGIWGGERRISVTLKFFIYTVFGSLFMLAALVYLYLQTPGPLHSSSLQAIYEAGRSLDANTSRWIFWALFIAFAIKMPLFPFHTWQADTYAESPSTATMLLAGIMSKMGVYGIIRWLIPVVPGAAMAYGDVVIIMGVIGVVYGSIIAIRQRDMKRVVAYSSFAHIGLMAAAVFSFNLDGMQGTLIQMLAHGINVVGLFYAIELIWGRTKTRAIDDLGGITQASPSFTVYFMIILLGSVALPLTNGFIGEFLMLKGVFDYNAVTGVIAGLTIILGAVYMLRLFQVPMFGNTTKYTQNFAKLEMVEGLTFLPLAIMVFWIGLYPATFMNLTEPSVQALLTDIRNASSSLSQLVR